MCQRLSLFIALMILALPLSTPHAEEGGDTTATEGPKKALYVPLAIGEGDSAKDKIVVNIKQGSRNRFMQIKVQAMTRDEKVYAAIKANQPALLDAMIMLFAHQDGATMSDIQQREQVRGLALTELQKVLGEVSGFNEGLEAVYFTDFVIQ